MTCQRGKGPLTALDAARLAFLPWAVTRCAVLAVAVIAVTFVGFPTDARTMAGGVAYLPQRWDATYYIGIAYGGYRYTGALDRFQHIAFFPAYPLLIRAVGRTLRLSGSAPAWYWLATAVSHVVFFAGLTYLALLASRDPDARPDRSLWLLATYPFSLFYSAPYSECLILLSTVASFYHLRRQHYVVSAGWAYVAGLARPNGFLLAPALLCDALTRGGSRHRRFVLPVVAPLLGLLTYSLFLMHTTGDPLAWTHVQAANGRTMANSMSTFVAAAHALRSGSLLMSTTAMMDVLNAAAGVFAIALVVPVTRRFGLGYGIFTLLNLAVPIAAGGTISLGRFTSTLWPLFLLTGAVLGTRGFLAAVCAWSSLQALLALLFFSWRPVF